MTVRNEDALERLYSNVKLICNQVTHFISDFDNEFLIKAELDKQIFEAVNESLKTNLADSYISSELIFNIVNAEDETEIITCLENARKEV